MKNGTNLGKGLAALLGEIDYTESMEESALQSIDIHKIKAGKMQPRQRFDSENMAHLIDSIKEKGVLQPILVRKMDDGFFEIIAGERRWRASKEAGLGQVPVIIIECDDEESLEIGLIENLQRDDLNPMEEAESLKKLIDDYGKIQEEVARAISKSRSYVANLVRLNSLPDYIKDLIRNGKISAGHARALLTADNMDDLVQEILNEKLSVRETEERTKSKDPVFQREEDPDLVIIEQSIQQSTGMPTKITINKRGGVIKMSFESYEQLDLLVANLKNDRIF